MTKISHIIMEKGNKDTDPFADYVWMGDMDKFDREIEAQIEEEFEEEEFIKSCIEQLLDEEEERETVFFQMPNDFDKNASIPDGQNIPEVPNIANMNGLEPNLTQTMNNLYISQPHHQHIQPLPIPIHQPPFQNGDIIYDNNGPVPSHHWYAGNTEPLQYQVPSSLIQNSTLNPNASPFVMNPNAKVFVPQYGGKSPDAEQ